MINKRKKSIEYFHAAPDNFNCAQALLKGFQQELNIPEEEVSKCRAWGGGRAENGICGALFAATLLVNDDEKVKKEFQQKMGSIYCRELKKNKKACEDCVLLADRLTAKRIKKPK